MEQGVNLLANFPLSSPFFFLTTEIRERPRKHINFAAKPVLKIIVYGNGLTQGPAHMEAPSNGLLVNPCWHNHIKLLLSFSLSPSSSDPRSISSLNITIQITSL